MSLSDMLIDIQRRETGADLSMDLRTELEEIADAYSVNRAPHWLLPIFEAVRVGKDTAVELFDFAGSDPSTFLYEAALLLKWHHVDTGEDITIEFPNLNRKVYISHEAHAPNGHGCSSYRVSALRS